MTSPLPLFDLLTSRVWAFGYHFSFLAARLQSTWPPRPLSFFELLSFSHPQSLDHGSARCVPFPGPLSFELLTASHPRSHDGAPRLDPLSFFELLPSPISRRCTACTFPWSAGPLSFFGLLPPSISQQCTMCSMLLPPGPGRPAPSPFSSFYSLSWRCASPLAPSLSSRFFPLSRWCASPWPGFSPLSQRCASPQPPLLLRASPIPDLMAVCGVHLPLVGWSPLLLRASLTSDLTAVHRAHRASPPKPRPASPLSFFELLLPLTAVRIPPSPLFLRASSLSHDSVHRPGRASPLPYGNAHPPGPLCFFELLSFSHPRSYGGRWCC